MFVVMWGVELEGSTLRASVLPPVVRPSPCRREGGPEVDGTARAGAGRWASPVYGLSVDRPVTVADPMKGAVSPPVKGSPLGLQVPACGGLFRESDTSPRPMPAGFHTPGTFVFEDVLFKMSGSYHGRESRAFSWTRF